MKRRHTLVINVSDSRCGACDKPADPRSMTHDRVLGYHPGPGCGERFVFVTSDYFGVDGLHERVKAMRPDLVPVGLNGVEGT